MRFVDDLRELAARHPLPVRFVLTLQGVYTARILLEELLHRVGYLHTVAALVLRVDQMRLIDPRYLRVYPHIALSVAEELLQHVMFLRRSISLIILLLILLLPLKLLRYMLFKSLFIYSNSIFLQHL